MTDYSVVIYANPWIMYCKDTERFYHSYRREKVTYFELWQESNCFSFNFSMKMEGFYGLNSNVTNGKII